MNRPMRRMKLRPVDIGAESHVLLVFVVGTRDRERRISRLSSPLDFYLHRFRCLNQIGNIDRITQDFPALFRVFSASLIYIFSKE